MQIFVSKDGQQGGPFSVDEIKQQLVGGVLTPQDYGWHEGLSEWQPLGTLVVLANNPAPDGPPKALPKPGSASGETEYRSGRKTSGLAITSLVLGICSYVLCLSILSGIPAIICGHLALGKIKRSKSRLKGKGLAIAGLVMGYVSLGFMLLWIPVMAGISVPAINQALVAAKETQSVANLKQISMACQVYASNHDGKYPDSLDQLNLPNKKVLNSALAADRNEQSYVYITGLTSSSPGETIFLYDKNVPNASSANPNLKKRAVARLNGTCELISDEEFAREVKTATP